MSRPGLRPGGQSLDGIAKEVVRPGGAAVARKPVEIGGGEPHPVGSGLGVQHLTTVVARASMNFLARSGKRHDIGLEGARRPIRNPSGLQRMGKPLDLPQLQTGARGHARLEGEPVRPRPGAGRRDRAHVRLDRVLGPAGISQDGDRVPYRLGRRRRAGLDQGGERLAVGKLDSCGPSRPSKFTLMCCSR